MNIIFAHDHKLRYVGDKFFTLGGLSDNITSRYTSIFDSLTIICRAIDVQEFDGNMVEIKNPKVRVEAIHSSSLIISSKEKKRIEKQVDVADGVIVRLPSFIGWITYKYAKKKNKPIFAEVVTCPWDSLWNHSIKGKLIAPIMYIRTRIAVNDSDYTLYVTQEFLQKRYPTKGTNIACSDVELLNLDDNILKKRKENIKFPKEEFIIGTLAAIDTKFKGQQYVIRAISILKKKGIICKYKLAGGGKNNYLKSQAKKYNVEELIEFMGVLPHKEIFIWLESLDLYIQPSLQEGMPRALIEAMSIACPAIGSTAGGIPELLDAEYVFEKKDVNKIVELIGSLNSSVLEEMALSNYNKSKEYSCNHLDLKRDKFYKDFSYFVLSKTSSK